MKGLKKVNVSIITPVAAMDEMYIRSCGASVAAQIQTGIEWILIIEQESALITEHVKDIQKLNQNLVIRVIEEKKCRHLC